ncbi:DUF2799 domain-containing protein [Vibrio sp. La 4.2.2]|uniref:DUF2799 domain-containing protein n=1 Tax=Vibrio sp. La 4.2.2 TaxID=2998830 RepID=UPI0022CDD0B0|nr:DUF2799 domain-containing protein [Vibrio sp. La 4.2.2]MDA0111135.1 DUF2799 domain-containing protein [Vibrio sp. La 4.2.2]
MRLLFIIGLLIMSGCAQQVSLTSVMPQDWQQHGQEQALIGYEKLSVQQLQSSTTIDFTEDLYQAYSNGYEEGRIAYCQQDPSILGKRGEMYRGICDDIKPTFRTWYNNGKASRGRYGY